jgi:hypothetical protein
MISEDEARREMSAAVERHRRGLASMTLGELEEVRTRMRRELGELERPVPSLNALCGKLWIDGPEGGLHGCLLEDDHQGLCRCCCGTEVDWGGP